MTTAKFVQPNFTTQDSATYKGSIDASVSVMSRISAMYAPHAADTPNMTIKVDAGSFLYNDAIVSNSQQTTATITAPSSNPRIDLVVIDSYTGVVSVITGAEAASPSPPALTAGKTPIAQIALSVGQTSILNANITDVRVSMGGAAPIDPVAGTAGLRTLGTGSQQACAGNDSRLSDARTPSNSSVSEAKMASAAVAQAALKTSSGSVSYTVTASAGIFTSIKTLPGGQYGFYPRTQLESSNGDGSNHTVTGEAKIFYNSTSVAPGGTLDTGIENNVFITITHDYSTLTSTLTVYQRYVTSSGEIYWIFILRDRVTKQIISIWEAPDHPCMGNGGDPDIVCHPFPDYDQATQEIIVINPTEKELQQLRSPKNISIIKALMTQYEIDDESSPEWPATAVTVGLPEGHDWSNMVGKTVSPIKEVITQPAFIICRSLKAKV